MKITFIGAGKIGGATAKGLIRSARVCASDITVTTLHAKTRSVYKKLGMQTCSDNASAVVGADIVIFAVKPWQIEKVITEVKSSLDYSKQILLSMAPGISSKDLFRFLEKSDSNSLPALAYLIPNTAIEICQSMTFISPLTTNEDQTVMLEDLFSACGKVMVVPEELMLAGTSVASCGIAYAMRYISASKQGASSLGLPQESVNQIVCQTVLGAAALINSHASEPEEEIDKVTTPNGLTLRGLNAMESSGFTEAVKKGITVVKNHRRRIVVKIGSNVLTREDGALNTTRVSSIVDQIVAARNMGYEVILVTSGAVACGRSILHPNNKLDEVQQRQLYSAVGQVRLMDLYYKLFLDYGIRAGQVLTTKNNFSGRREYNNQRNCMEVMLQSGVIPIVNENDTVSITELMFTDNDELSGLVATMMGAEALVILSNVDGVYEGDPSDENASVLEKVRPNDDFHRYITDNKSEFGRGGMVSKCRIASQTASNGVKVLIANGKRENILLDVLERPQDTIHTEFLPE